MMADASQTPVDLDPGKSLSVDVLMLQNPEEMLDFAITGTVTDAVTGDPLGGAWIAPTGLAEAGNTVRYLTNNSGTTLTVSGQDGAYRMPAFPVRDNGGMGDIIGLTPISVGRNGYRPRTFVGEGEGLAHEWYLTGGLLPAPADSVLELDIALEPVPDGGVPAAEMGTLSGRVVSDDDAPQAGVWVNVTLMELGRSGHDPRSGQGVGGRWLGPVGRRRDLRDAARAGHLLPARRSVAGRRLGLGPAASPRWRSSPARPTTAATSTWDRRSNR